MWKQKEKFRENVFYFSDKAPVSKVILGSLSISHVGLNLGMFSHFQKYLVCKMPGKYI